MSSPENPERFNLHTRHRSLEVSERWISASHNDGRLPA